MQYISSNDINGQSKLFGLNCYLEPNLIDVFVFSDLINAKRVITTVDWLTTLNFRSLLSNGSYPHRTYNNTMSH